MCTFSKPVRPDAARNWRAPAAAFVRGADVNRLRYLYSVIGGALIGLAGPMYSLSVKAGWKGTISGLDGIGWIALALTIFGGWNPLRAALGGICSRCCSGWAWCCSPACRAFLRRCCRWRPSR